MLALNKAHKMTNTEYLRQHLLKACGYTEVAQSRPALNSLLSSEWSDTFEQLMHNRMVMGAFRYGLLHAAGKVNYDRVEAMIGRLQEFQQTGNTELLVDVANLCLLEFEEGRHPLKHFKAHDDRAHVKIKQ